MLRDKLVEKINNGSSRNPLLEKVDRPNGFCQWGVLVVLTPFGLTQKDRHTVWVCVCTKGYHEVEGVGVIKDVEVKTEEIESSHRQISGVGR